MGAKRELEVGMNEHINVVLRAALAAGEEGSGLQPDGRKAALLVAGLLTAAKVAVVQAGQIVAELGLDGICADAAALSDLPGRADMPVFTMPGSDSAERGED